MVQTSTNQMEPSLRPPRPPARRPRLETGSAALSTMPLSELRDYRQSLLAEDDRVSYWRRLVHARLDLQRASEQQSAPLTVDQITAALRATGAGGNRRVFAPIAAEAPLPRVPALEEFWQAEPDGANLDAALAELEAELSEYRRAVHLALDAATAELVVRYRQAPAEAIALLPEVER